MWDTAWLSDCHHRLMLIVSICWKSATAALDYQSQLHSLCSATLKIILVTMSSDIAAGHQHRWKYLVPLHCTDWYTLAAVNSVWSACSHLCSAYRMWLAALCCLKCGHVSLSHTWTRRCGELSFHNKMTPVNHCLYIIWLMEASLTSYDRAALPAQIMKVGHAHQQTCNCSVINRELDVSTFCSGTPSHNFVCKEHCNATYMQCISLEVSKSQSTAPHMLNLAFCCCRQQCDILPYSYWSLTIKFALP